MRKKLPQHQKLYDKLKLDILKSRYSVGDLLPSENTLCEQYSITRPTVRQALNGLEQEGLIRRHHGKGSIVQPAKQGLGILTSRGTSKGIGNKKMVTKVISGPKHIEWPNEFPFTLTQNEVNSKCIVLERLRSINKNPVLFEKTYIPNYNLSKFTSINFNNNSLFETLMKEYGIEVKRGTQNIRAIRTNKNMAQLFKTTVGSPLLFLERTLETNRAGFRFFTLLYGKTDEYFVFEEF